MAAHENPFPSSTDEMSGTPGAAGAYRGSVSGHGASHGSALASSSVPTDMLDKVVEKAHATIDRLAETAAPHVQRLSQGASSASELLHDRAGQARELGDEWTQSLRNTVRDNPLATVAAALALGVIIAKLSR